MRSNLATASNAYNDETGSTETVYILQDNSSAVRPNVYVAHLDFSCVDPAAVWRITFGRTENANSETLDFSGYPFAGNEPQRTVPGLNQTTSLSITDVNQVLGRYYVSGGQPFQLEFSEPLECLKDASSSTDQAFILAVKRMDTGTSAKYYVNVWYGSY